MGNKKRKSRDTHYSPTAAVPTAPAIPVDKDTIMGASPSLLPPLPQFTVSTFNLIQSQPNNSGPTTAAVTTENTEEWEVVHRSKKAKKEKLPKANSYPELVVSPQKVKRQIQLSDLQGLALWLVADGAGPQWLLVRHKPEIRRVVVLMVPGFTADMFDGRLDLGEIPEPPTPNFTSEEDYYPIALTKEKLAPCLQDLPDMFPHLWSIRCSGDARYGKLHSPISSFLNSPLPKNAEPNSASSGQKKLKVTGLLMTLEELVENEYVLHTSQLAEWRKLKQLEETDADREALAKRTADNWVESDLSKTVEEDNQSGSVTEGKQILSIDCEMCQTAVGYELTRISIVNWDNEVVYDTLVKPTNPIIDYVTAYSGITPEMLAPITTTLADVQSHLLTIITPSTILVGQSLNSDLNALHLSHPHIIDTSCIYHHTRGPPYKASLKWLTQRYLKRAIQSTAADGHDSIEDARACLDLLKLKLEKGPQFGTADESRESIFKRIARTGNGKKTAIIDYGGPAKFYPHATVALPATTDDEIVDQLAKVVNGDELAGIPRCDFIWGRLRSLEAARGFLPKSGEKQDPDVPLAPIHPDPPKKEFAAKVEETVGRIRKVYESLPKCSALVVYSGTGDPRRWRRLEEVQKRFKEEYKVKKWDELSVQWTDTEEQKLREEFKEARRGVGFMVVK